MENEKIIRIKEFLMRHGSSIDTISKSKVSQLEKIDDAIQVRLSEITKAKETLRDKAINVSVIAADTGIARKTFYNNEILRLFVEEYSSSSDEKTVSAGDLERLKAKCEELEQQIRLFLLRDFETENLRHENMKLQIEIKNLQDRNTVLEEQYEQLQEDYTESRRKALNDVKIIQIDKYVDKKDN